MVAMAHAGRRLSLPPALRPAAASFFTALRHSPIAQRQPRPRGRDLNISARVIHAAHTDTPPLN